MIFRAGNQTKLPFLRNVQDSFLYITGDKTHRDCCKCQDFVYLKYLKQYSRAEKNTLFPYIVCRNGKCFNLRVRQFDNKLLCFADGKNAGG